MLIIVLSRKKNERKRDEERKRWREKEMERERDGERKRWREKE